MATTIDDDKPPDADKDKALDFANYFVSYGEMPIMTSPSAPVELVYVLLPQPSCITRRTCYRTVAAWMPIATRSCETPAVLRIR